ncbi:MAG: hypothetical protein ACYTGN_01480 [Planctomycetota bacterium]|jgi:hypothetical protein
MSLSRFRSSLLLLLFAACAAPAPRPAGDWPEPPDHVIALSTEEAPDAAERHAFDEHFKRASGHHFVNLFLGVVANRRDQNGETIGIDYEYRISQKFGAGAFIDWSLGTARFAVLGVAAYWHPLDRFSLLTGPGVEVPVESGVEGHENMLWRTGGFYEFVAGEITIAPALFFDFVEGGEWTVVAGLNFGKRW